jgi:hypothetical protein
VNPSLVHQLVGSLGEDGIPYDERCVQRWIIGNEDRKSFSWEIGRFPVLHTSVIGKCPDISTAIRERMSK